MNFTPSILETSDEPMGASNNQSVVSISPAAPSFAEVKGEAASQNVLTLRNAPRELGCRNRVPALVRRPGNAAKGHFGGFPGMI